MGDRIEHVIMLKIIVSVSVLFVNNDESAFDACVIRTDHVERSD